ncbi:hypothetical protein FSP39_008596 [Pinctada imbricata]|uniref:Uncharacterized protein n=1 Tax=Pinctada imbricata TaxID=66713 RepID=A0AA88XT72_PINIB|nr:hypothetical protein FSP39_008596 [Pinctada imbricata]
MLANLVELGKNKCEQYWPKGEKDKLSIGIYEVIMQKEKFYGAYNIRELLLKCLETKEQRKVVQFHFTNWPDHGTADAMQLAIFQHVIESEATQNTGPMVVHCSAGIGRTGTYIALNAMTKWIRNHSKVDVYSFVSSMRNNRMNMIQTAVRYLDNNLFDRTFLDKAYSDHFCLSFEILITQNKKIAPKHGIFYCFNVNTSYSSCGNAIRRDNGNPSEPSRYMVYYGKQSTKFYYIIMFYHRTNKLRKSLKHQNILPTSLNFTHRF